LPYNLFDSFYFKFTYTGFQNNIPNDLL
jgi:hypothetical protein